MIKKLLTISCVILFVSILNLKTADAQIKIGPVAGVNFSDITGDFNSDGLHTGFFFGALVNLGITKYLMVEPQVLYSMRGAKSTGDDLKMNYIEIPVWLRYQLSGGLNFNAGPYAGFLLSAERADKDVKNDLNTLDFGLGAGIGYQMGGGLGFALNYSQGFAKVFDTNNDNSHNTCIKISASYTLGGKRE